ncbi:MAG: PIN domain nuclease [Bryobacter sp.]|nr:PIN domain nuclease [Bryobacter sp.]
MFDLLVIRIFFILLLAVCGWFMQPFRLESWQSALAGLGVGVAIVLFEVRLKQVSLKRLIGAAIGSVLGILGAYLIALILGMAVPPGSQSIQFLQVAVLCWMAYTGLIVGANKGDLLNLAAFGGVFGGEKATKNTFKILDTSVIIDGRIADIAETGFLDGIIVIPQFVLRELQLVADSADSMKRNRGRRGLDILQKLQKMPDLNIQILEDDFPQVREVDLKLIELAKLYDCSIVTNDFNLNKVAGLHGVNVLNINELANALKPIVLPGEVMRVVVDNARKLISKTIDITVTSVLQTTAGKMIFGKHDERSHAVYEKGEPKPDRQGERPERSQLRESAAREQPAPTQPH